MSKTSYAVTLSLLVASVVWGEIVFVDFGSSGAHMAGYNNIDETFGSQNPTNLLDENLNQTGISISVVTQGYDAAHTSFVTNSGTEFGANATTDTLTGSSVRLRVNGLFSDVYDFTFFAAAGQRDPDDEFETRISVEGSSGTETGILELDDPPGTVPTQDIIFIEDVAPDDGVIFIDISANKTDGSYHIGAMKLNGSPAAAVPECSSFLCLGLSVLAVAGWRRYGGLKN